ncbi:hypothetical protein WDU94_000275 [Cyamophila willieti]
MTHNMTGNLGQTSNKKYSDLLLTDTSNYSRPTSSSGSVCSDGSDVPIKNRRNLYVANLDNDISESELRLKFLRFGKIVSVYLITNRPTLPGCGFVNYSTHEEAQAAIDSLNGSIWNGKKIRVDFAFKKIAGKSSGPPAPPNGPNLVKPTATFSVGKSSVPLAVNGSAAVKPTPAGGNKSTPVTGVKAGHNGPPLNGQNLDKNNIKAASTGKNDINNTSSTVKTGALNEQSIVKTTTNSNNAPKNFGKPINDIFGTINGTSEELTSKTETKDNNKMGKSVTKEKVRGEVSENGNLSEEEGEESDDGYANTDGDSKKRNHHTQGSVHNLEYKDGNIEHILTQVDNAIRNVFEKDKMRQIKALKRQMEIELSNNFSEPESYRIVDHLLDEVKRTITKFVKLDGNELLRSQVDRLKESIREWYGKDNGRIMEHIEQLSDNLKLFEIEENKKAELVTQMILIEKYLETFLDTGTNIQIGLLERGVRKIERAKILFLTENMRFERLTRLDLIKNNLKSLRIHDDAKSLIKAIYEELKESVKNAYVGFPMRPKLGKKVQTELAKLKSDLSEFATEAEIKLQITFELNHMETEIDEHNKGGLRKFLAEQKEILEEQLAAKGRYDDEVFDPAFWKDIEKFLLESCLEGDRATASTASKDASGGVNLYINNLHPHVDSSRLEREFSRFGTIVSARVFPQSKKLYGTAVVSSGPNTKLYGFVKFERPASAVRALEEMNGEHILAREVEVSVATNADNLKTYFKYLLSRTMQL